MPSRDVIIDKSCPLCKKESTVSVTQESLKEYANGALIQNAFPYLDANERELIMTGICGICWDKEFLR